MCLAGRALDNKISINIGAPVKSLARNTANDALAYTELCGCRAPTNTSAGNALILWSGQVYKNMRVALDKTME
jgi:hypothetical protein